MNDTISPRAGSVPPMPPMTLNDALEVARRVISWVNFPDANPMPSRDSRNAAYDRIAQLHSELS